MIHVLYQNSSKLHSSWYNTSGEILSGEVQVIKFENVNKCMSCAIRLSEYAAVVIVHSIALINTRSIHSVHARLCGIKLEVIYLGVLISRVACILKLRSHYH